jgi:peptide methionine sulfoxide reductase MsrA
MKSEHADTERAILAGGCFRGMQDLIRKHPGVIEKLSYARWSRK